MITVSAFLIVRDESRFLPGCLESLAGSVDEIVVVDTGSVDATKNIAKSGNARIYDWRWTDDFAAARNFAISQCRSDWLLYIDADERLTAPRSVPLGLLLEENAIAAKVAFLPRSGFSRYGEWRLFRRDDRIRFTGAIHETIVPAIRSLAGIGQLLEVEVEIDHLGYDEPSKSKLHRNLPLLRRMVHEQPQRIYYWKDLAETLYRHGDRKEALAVAKRGIVQAVHQTDAESRAAVSLIYQLLIQDAMLTGGASDELLTASFENCPADCTLWLMQAHHYLETRRPREALHWTAKLLATDPNCMRFGLLAHERAIFGYKAHEAAALAHLQLGDRREAANAFRRAHEDCPADRSFQLRAAALGANDSVQT